MLETNTYPTLLSAIEQQGRNDIERGQRLQIDEKTIQRLRRRLPMQLRPFILSPSLLEALLADVRQNSPQSAS